MFKFLNIINLNGVVKQPNKSLVSDMNNIFSSPVPNQKRLVIKLRRAWELQLITQLRLWKLPVPNNKQSKPTPKRYDKSHEGI